MENRKIDPVASITKEFQKKKRNIWMANQINNKRKNSIVDNSNGASNGKSQLSANQDAWKRKQSLTQQTPDTQNVMEIKWLSLFLKDKMRMKGIFTINL